MKRNQILFLICVMFSVSGIGMVMVGALSNDLVQLIIGGCMVLSSLIIGYVFIGVKKDAD